MRWERRDKETLLIEIDAKYEVPSIAKINEKIEENH